MLELALIALLLCVCVYCSITDMKASIIENRILLLAAGLGLVLNAVYYAVFAQGLIGVHLLDLAVLSAISLLFYGFHFWAAGDSKLLILISFLLPARMFGWEPGGRSPAITLLILTFSIAFLYLIAESIYLGIKKRNLFKMEGFQDGILRFVKSYILCGTYLMLINNLVVTLLPDLYARYSDLFMLGSFFAAILIGGTKLLRRAFIFLPCLFVAVALTCSMAFQGRIILNPVVFLALLSVVLLRMLAEKYNYEVIQTQNIKKGMVLSTVSAMQLNLSKAFSQPIRATEDVRTRLSEEDAELIREWGNSRHGKKEIIIVRKIPFAIFISVGTVLFMAVRMWVP